MTNKDNAPAVDLFAPGANCWRVEPAKRFSLIVDADDYFAVARAAMIGAKRRIMLIGWDFDARIRLGPENAPDGGPAILADFIPWLVDRNPDLHIYLLRWDTGMLKALFRGDTLLTALRWKRHKRLTARIDSQHPFAASHHQKIVAIDDCLAFCGGIDMTSARWDTRAHEDEAPARVRPDGTAYQPWHDATSAFDGAAAAAIGQLARDRWEAACGEKLEPVSGAAPCWPEPLTPGMRDIDIAIARTYPQMRHRTAIYEIEQLYVDLIASARTCIYAESQYFASRAIALAIAERLQQADCPEIVIVNPLTADGWLEPIAMDTARAQLFAALQRIDTGGKLRIYHPQTAAGAPIYVHAKVTVIDDRVLRVGSSNFNNRSMGLDTECDVAIDAERPGNGHASATIAAIRNDLVAEHLGVPPARIATLLAERGSLIAVIEALRGEGRTLVPYVVPRLNDVEAWLADNEILDPEGPDALFEAMGKGGLFRGWRQRLRGWTGGA